MDCVRFARVSSEGDANEYRLKCTSSADPLLGRSHPSTTSVLFISVLFSKALAAVCQYHVATKTVPLYFYGEKRTAGTILYYYFMRPRSPRAPPKVGPRHVFVYICIYNDNIMKILHIAYSVPV